jgi:hypothetical protein
VIQNGRKLELGIIVRVRLMIVINAAPINV